VTNTALDKFGKLLMERFRDSAINHYDDLARGHWKAPSLQKLQSDLAGLSDEQQSMRIWNICRNTSATFVGHLLEIGRAHV